jgi:hypothetical protein
MAPIEPPFYGTIFLDPDIITPEDPSSFLALTPDGQGSRSMFDRRVNNWISVEAYLFQVTFDDGLSVEIQVNPEFGSSALAQVEAEKYAIVIGRFRPITLWSDARPLDFGFGDNVGAGFAAQPSQCDIGGGWFGSGFGSAASRWRFVCAD